MSLCSHCGHWRCRCEILKPVPDWITFGIVGLLVCLLVAWLHWAVVR